MGRFGGRNAPTISHHIPPSLALISFYLCGTAIQLKESISWKWRSHSFKHWNRATKQTWKCALACLPLVSSWDSRTSNDWGITVKQFARPTFVQIAASHCDFHSLVIHTVWQFDVTWLVFCLVACCRTKQRSFQWIWCCYTATASYVWIPWLYAPLPLFRLLDECREDPDWTDEFTVADLVQKYAASLKTLLSIRGHVISI